MADAKMLNRQKIVERLKKVPESIRKAAEEALKKEVGDLVEAQKRAAPVSDDLEKTPGQFRDSIHAYENPDRPLSYRILADARDAKGEFIGPHIEFGHMAPDGSHVAPRPSFFPTYRARKKGMRSRLSAAVRKAAREAFPKGTSNG